MTFYRSLQFLSLPVSRQMSSRTGVLSDLRAIFDAGLDSVKPATIFRTNQCLKIVENKLKVLDDEFDIGKIHLVGFGKAVHGLATEVEAVLKSRLVSGVISVPQGGVLKESSGFEIFEGAKDNFPDENSFAASREILKRCQAMGSNDILLCLISGGGSALLPYPKNPITLQEKAKIIRSLSKNGASIDEMNVVRIAMSEVKGGKLALAAKNARKVISLIMSDIVNDPLDLIASGPTVAPDQKLGKTPLEVLKKFKIEPESHILDVIKAHKPVTNDEIPNVKNYIIASNEIAIKNSMETAKKLGYSTIFLSKSITGDVKNVCSLYESITKHILSSEKLPEEISASYPSLQKSLKEASESKSKGICIISGGEPVVTVSGDGIGGRNQELALRFANFCTKNQFSNVFLLSAGTDGIDGPSNDAAGAIGTTYDAITNDLIEKFINNNDSYNFYKGHCPGFHVVTGHTGTNVMDLHVLVVVKDQNSNSKL
ncbi:glycerate kinase [Culicoides brevitarsis]|uniref:glycerate kinase n=1 Tax=Culicoides brevitarsis TaxID=469753 RepID=UPI00307BE2D3